MQTSQLVSTLVVTGGDYQLPLLYWGHLNYCYWLVGGEGFGSLEAKPALNTSVLLRFI